MKGFTGLICVCVVLLIAPVSGIEFISDPKEGFLVGGEGRVKLNCTVTDNVVDFYNIKIFRATPPGSQYDSFNPIATINRNGPVLSQGLENVFSIEPESTIDGPLYTLRLTMNMAQLRCPDSSSFMCEAAYDDGSNQIVQSNLTLNAYVLPSILTLKGMKNNIEEVGQTEKPEFIVGDTLKLTCDANIGSMEATKIDWARSSVTDFQGPSGTNWIPVTGVSPQYEINDGTPRRRNDQVCAYDRTATLTVNISEIGDIRFQCSVTVNGYPAFGTYTSTYTTVPMEFHLFARSKASPPQEAASAGSGGNTGAIAGGVVGGLVLIVIVVLLVYFLWYRRRSAGEDYTTKEEYGSENPNMAPPVETYASVDKSRRRGHENKGLDEPHESRPYYSNAPGKSNWGMDRDADDYDDRDYDRDGSPTMNHGGISHMGMDGQIGTGV